MKTLVICALVLSCLSLILSIVAIIMCKSKNKYNNQDKVDVIDGVRYSVNGDKFIKGDVVLAQNKDYIAQKEGELLPGKYIVLSTNENTKFNLRINNFVREYNSGDFIVLAENEKISAVSQSVILR